MRAGASRICLSLTAPTLREDLALLESRRGYVDMAELRADLLDPSELRELPAFPERAGIALILTIRRERDGGAWAGDEPRRRELLGRSLGGGYAFVDLEADLEDPALSAAASRHGTRVIRSRHDLSGLPREIAETCRSLIRSAGEIPKLAVMPRGCGDLVRLARAFRELEGEQRILLGMGEFGLFTRILAGKLGNYLTYCSVSGSRAAAPGHLDPRVLVELYRFRDQNRDTFLCGVIGNPVAHSRSPEFHNRGYQLLGLNGVYVPFLVDDVPAFFTLSELLELRGFSVTIPHKQAVLEHLDACDELPDRIGACNTVVRRPGGGWHGTNTDVDGFLGPLKSEVPELLRPSTRATVIGAGGAARSVVYALRSCGIRPLVVNRTVERARALAERFDCRWAGLDGDGIERIGENADLMVQATAVGMEPDNRSDALPSYRFRGTEVVYDLVYQPQQTAFLSRARRAGCRTLSGIAMLFHQGAAQFRHYTGRQYPARELDRMLES